MAAFEGDDGDGPPQAPAGAKPEGTGTIARRLVGELLTAMPSDAAPELEVIAGAGGDAGQRLVLAETGRSYLVGRGDHCALPLAADEISREHAIFVRTPDGVTVRDLGSKNGLRVAGARLDGERRLRHGDLVEVGPVTLRLRDPAERYLGALDETTPPSGSRPNEFFSARAGAAMTVVAVVALLVVVIAAITLVAS